MKDMDDIDGPPPASRVPPAVTSWENLGAPGVFGGFIITANMLHAIAQSFVEPVPVERDVSTDRLASCLGWIEAVEMRAEALWGLVRWLTPRRFNICAEIRIGRFDSATGATESLKLMGAIARGAEPAIDAAEVNYSNITGARPLTMADLLAAKKAIDALPRPETDATLSPDAFQALNEVIRQGDALVDGYFATRPYGGLTIHIDETLPAGVWHKGKPR